MKKPKEYCSVLKTCPRGGMTGIYVTNKQLKGFSKMIGSNFIDEVIPLEVEEQPIGKECPHCNGNADKIDEINNSAYWEDETGKHGFCCATCGLVFQWG